MYQGLKEIGKRICERRKSMGYTQEQLAEMMDVSIQMISNLERGNKAIKIKNLINLSNILQVSTDYILMGKTVGTDRERLNGKINLLNDRDYKIIDKLVDYCVSDDNAE